MKSIQSILTIILAIFLIGMMPNLADAKTKTIKISPDKLVPYTGSDNYMMWPAYVTSAMGPCYYWANIKFPKVEGDIQTNDKVDKSWTYFIYVFVSDNTVQVQGIEIKFSIK